MKKNNFPRIPFKIGLILAYLSFFAFYSCSSFPKSERSQISSDHKYLLLYANDEGIVYQANLSVQAEYKFALDDLERFQSETLLPMGRRYQERLKEVSAFSSELKKDSNSLVRRLGGALAIAAITPVPGAFETTLTVGLIYVTYKKIMEKPEERERKKHVEFLITECGFAEDSLEKFKKTYLVPFVPKWQEEFKKEENHFVNSENESDIRLLDSLMEKYSIDKEWIKTNTEWEIKSSFQHCNRELKPIKR